MTSSTLALKLWLWNDHEMASVQVFEAATDAGADDIVPANDMDEHLEGYKVKLFAGPRNW